MSDLQHDWTHHLIAKNLPCILEHQYLLQPTLTFIYEFEHRHDRNRIETFLGYLWLFKITCPFYDLLISNLTSKKYTLKVPLKSQWTKTDDEHFHRLKVQMCDHIEIYVNNLERMPIAGA